MKRRRISAGRRPTEPDIGGLQREIKWCDKYSYFIDIEACQARAGIKRFCGRCVWQRRQIPLPFPE